MRLFPLLGILKVPACLPVFIMMLSRLQCFTVLFIFTSGIGRADENASFSLTHAQSFLKTYCLACHQAKTPAGGFNITDLSSGQSMTEKPTAWGKMAARVREGEMPPRGSAAPSAAKREQFTTFIDAALKSAACADGISPGPAPLRRLNRNEYAATIRDLLNIHINAGQGLPADGAGGEGFDNAAETLFLSPIHAEKYLEAARQALEYGASDPKSRATFLAVAPSATTSPEEAAQANLGPFLRRAFRRPTRPGELEKYLALFRAAQRREKNFDGSLLFAMRGVLVSPHFLFRLEEPNPQPEPRLLGDYELATRLSYFLWGSMPDDKLLELAEAGKLHEPEVLQEQAIRLLRDVKSRDFAESFVEQWLNTRELGRDIKPDRTLFPSYYDAEIQAAIKYEPILFFHELLTTDLSLLNLLDSTFTFLTNKLQKFYELPATKLKQQPVRVELPDNSHRGGLLGMAAVLAVSSYPQRTSPVLRGKWLLDAILGTPPPPPPPNVPQLKESTGSAPASVRERLTLHRQNPACASCHSRIDPLGFALDNFDVLGRFRTEDGGKPIDAKGELPDGTQFEGIDGLKKVLLSRKELFLRNLTSKMLGYALGRGLTLEERCTVDNIVKALEKNDYSGQTLIREIVLSVPFRYQSGTAPGVSVSLATHSKEPTH